MAKRKSKAARGGKVQLTFRNLKKPGATSGTAMKSLLKQASKKRIAFVVLNAPFKLRPLPKAA
jgi:hypothetical protein